MILVVAPLIPLFSSLNLSGTELKLKTVLFLTKSFSLAASIP